MTTQHCYKLGWLVGMVISVVIIGFFGLWAPDNFSNNVWLGSSLLSWAVLLLICLSISIKYPTAGILTAGLCTVVVLRISGIYDMWNINLLAVSILLILFALYLCETHNRLSVWESAMTFIRMYVGFDLMAHATEKLFAGPMPYMGDVQAFINLHAFMPNALVILAGLCEFGGAIAIGLGLFTRLGAICTALYLLIATVMGGHFSLGFIWANAGGGWEYPVMWIVLVLVFAVEGAGSFSLDRLIVNHFNLPLWYYKLIGQPVAIKKSGLKF